MTTVRTFYWHDQVYSRRQLFCHRGYHRRISNEFVHGNAGDLFAREALAHFYPDARPLNTTEGPRILCVGSIAHRMVSGDVLSGVGCKTRDLPSIGSESIYIHGLRGPLSYDVFKDAGYDVSEVQFLADPGLLIGQMVPDRSPKKGRVIFIPHYRERAAISKNVPNAIRIVDIDNPPNRVAREIQLAEVVYSSSLHGIIFAHALGRPGVYVRPLTAEPLLKFEDYFLSVGISPPKPLDSIADANFKTTPTSPPTLSVDISKIVFPPVTRLMSLGIIG